MKKLLCCLQHELTPIQLNELKNYNIIYAKDVYQGLWARVSNCGDDINILRQDAAMLSLIIGEYSAVILPVGSPIFMFFLSNELVRNHSVERPIIMFAHSIREIIDEINSDGSVKKVSIFKHLKFIYLT